MELSTAQPHDWIADDRRLLHTILQEIVCVREKLDERIVCLSKDIKHMLCQHSQFEAWLRCAMPSACARVQPSQEQSTTCAEAEPLPQWLPSLWRVDEEQDSTCSDGSSTKSTPAVAVGIPTGNENPKAMTAGMTALDVSGNTDASVMRPRLEENAVAERHSLLRVPQLSKSVSFLEEHDISGKAVGLERACTFESGTDSKKRPGWNSEASHITNDSLFVDVRKHWTKMMKPVFKRGRSSVRVMRIRSSQVPGLSFHFKLLMRSNMVEVCGMIMIIANAVFIGYQVEWDAYNSSADDSNAEHPMAFIVFDTIFACFFVLEFVFRCWAFGFIRFMTCKDGSIGWNIFDALIVGLVIFDFFVNHVIGGDAIVQLSSLRTIRLLRIVRLLRVIRVLSFLRDFRMLLQSVLNSFRALLWAMCLLAMLLYGFGICMTQGVYEYCNDTGTWHEEDTDVLRHRFGTLPQSMLSLYAAMAGGISWIELSDAVAPLPPIYMMIFLLFTCVAIFAVLNVLTGAFVEASLQVAQLDRESLIQDEFKEKETYIRNMEEFFNELDYHRRGSITLEELKIAFRDPRCLAYFNALKLDVTDVQTLFVLLDKDRTGAIESESFLRGCLKLKGEAKALDIAKLQYQAEWLMHNMNGLQETIFHIGEAIPDFDVPARARSCSTSSVRMEYKFGEV